MNNKKTKIVSALLLLAVLAGIGIVVGQPPPPPPVPQNIGIYDSSFAFLKTNATDQSMCRTCHQTSGTNISGGYNNTIGGVPTRHHNMVAQAIINPLTGTAFQCQDCHPNTPGIGNGILLDRSCTDCHNASNFWADGAFGAHVGNLSRPHHFNTSYDDAFTTLTDKNPAQSRNCKFCHGSFVGNYNDSHYQPSYASDLMITPFGSFKATSNVALSTPLFHSDGTTLENKTWGGCESCHLGTVNASGNLSLAALGQFTGIPILSNHDTHHQTILDGFVNVSGTFASLGGRTPGAVCSWCHVIQPGSTAHGGVNLQTFTNPFTGETIVDGVEVRNSTIEATSPLEPGTLNVTINGTGCEKCHSVQSLHNIQFQYQQNGPQGFGHINNNTDCSGCHDEWVPTNTFTPGALIPYVNSVSPSVIVAGTATTLTITGSNFVNDPYTSVVTIDGGAPITPTSITDTQITVSVPALGAGDHIVQLVKGGDTLSKPATLTVVSNVHVTSAKLSNGAITITGTGFGTKPATNSQLYVSVSHAGNQIVSKSIMAWSDTSIKANVQKLPIAAGDVVTVMTSNAGESTGTIS